MFILVYACSLSWEWLRLHIHNVNLGAELDNKITSSFWVQCTCSSVFRVEFFIRFTATQLQHFSMCQMYMCTLLHVHVHVELAYSYVYCIKSSVFHTLYYFQDLLLRRSSLEKKSRPLRKSLRDWARQRRTQVRLHAWTCMVHVPTVYCTHHTCPC